MYTVRNKCDNDPPAPQRIPWFVISIFLFIYLTGNVAKVLETFNNSNTVQPS